MEKRTSDFMSLTAIVGGAGIGLGLTSLFLVDRAAPVAQLDDVSVEVHVVQRADVSTVKARTEHFAVILTGEHDYSFGTSSLRSISPLRFRIDLDEREIRTRRDRMKRARADVVRGGARVTFEIEDSFLKEYGAALEEYQEALEELEGLESLTIDILHGDEDEDKRRRRRRRRPHREAPDASGN